MAPKSFGAETPNLAKDQAAMDKCCAYRRVGSDESHGRLWEGATSGDFVVYEMARFERKKNVQTKSGESLKIWFYGKDSKVFFSKHLQHLIYAIDDMLTNVGIKMEITKI